jgi:hypothetical protein
MGRPRGGRGRRRANHRVAIELFEFAVFKHPSATGLGAYQDTVGDLAMDMLGVGITAAAILALRSLRQGRASGRGGHSGDVRRGAGEDRS